MPSKFWPIWLLVAIVITAAVYQAGLSGPFLFDDHIHITQNRWVKIESLSWPDIVQAWHSSFSAFPNNRPLAQLSFGINHALGGLDAWHFKATNLAIHLLTGLAVFLFARLLYRAAVREGKAQQELGFALVLSAFWLLTPMHVSTVLYTVQRMAQLSTLATVLALSSYVWGRLQLASGRSGYFWMLGSIPLGIIGFFAKENTVLIPLYLLVLEITVLAKLPRPTVRLPLNLLRLGMIVLPLVAGLVYFATDPGLVDYSGRPFSLTERILTETRVLALYLRLLLVPDVGLFGLYHDDLVMSQGWLTPPTTLLAALFLLGLLIVAAVLRKRHPLASFGVLFFFAAHALESTFIPLELIFEHRNYVASIGPFTVLAYLVVRGSANFRIARAAALVAILLLASQAVATWVRVGNWVSYEDFVLTGVDNHPNSSRYNFMAAQLMILTIGKAEGDKSPLDRAANEFLSQGLRVDPGCINCLFGKLVLDLHMERRPEPELLDRLGFMLQNGHVGASRVSISQFSYLVRWLQGGGNEIPRQQVERLFDRALQNPRWASTGRAGIEAAYRKYHEFVTGDLERALLHATRAVEAWPDQWIYRIHRVNVLRKLSMTDAALQELTSAEALVSNASQQEKIETLRMAIRESGKGE